MKLKLIFCIFLLYVTLILNAQPWQGNNPVWTNSSVGIGTQSPLHDLGIGAAIFGLQKTDASPNAGYIRFGDNTGWKLHIGRGKESYGSPVNTDITGVLMTIQDYGKVGIGTTDPINRLDVVGATSEPSLNYTSVAVANFRGLSNTQLAISSSSAIPFGVSLQVKHSILDGYSYPLILQPVGGNVGIGTTTPDFSQKLTVNGDIRMLGSGNKIVVGTAGIASDYLLLQDVVSGNPAFQWIQDGSAKFTIEGETGNVGIGTTNPGNYKLNVSGKIRADEVVVNMTGADFVFSPGYKLPELSEIEKYIKENKHLPGFASAMEMEENGVNISEMQTKLLKKIEELTLYAIEQEKKNTQLEQRIKELEELLSKKLK